MGMPSLLGRAQVEDPLRVGMKKSAHPRHSEPANLMEEVMNFNFQNYVGKQIDLTLLESNTLITGTLNGVNDFGVFVTGGTGAVTFNARFYPWAVIQYLDLSKWYAAKAA
jgi:hypothetical protein